MLHHRAVMMMKEATKERADDLEVLLLRQPVNIHRVGHRILSYLIDVRELHDHQRPEEWALFAIPVCVFSGSISLSTALPLGPDQVAGIREALVKSGLAKPDPSLVLHGSLIPCTNLWRLRLAEQLKLLHQARGGHLPERLAFPPLPLARGTYAPYMLLGAATNHKRLLSPIKNVSTYKREVHDAIQPSLENVPGRSCTVGMPRPYSLALRTVIGDFLSPIVRAGLASGGGPMTLTILGLDDVSGDAEDGAVRVFLKGHPLDFEPFVFHVPPVDRQFVLQNLRQRFKGFPVTIRLPSDGVPA